MNPTTVLLMKYGNVVGLEYLKAFLDHGFGLAAVIFEGDSFDARDREIIEERTKGHYQPLFLGEALGNHRVNLYFVKKHNSRDCEALLRGLKVEIGILGGTDILKENILKTAQRGFLNCHPGILPDYRGCSCVEWAILNDDPVGATCHQVTPVIDQGPLIYQEALPVLRGWSYEEVRAAMISHLTKVMLKGYEIFSKDNKPCLKNGSKGKYYKTMGADLLNQVVARLKTQTYKHLVG